MRARSINDGVVSRLNLLMWSMSCFRTEWIGVDVDEKLAEANGMIHGGRAKRVKLTTFMLLRLE